MFLPKYLHCSNLNGIENATILNPSCFHYSLKNNYLLKRSLLPEHEVLKRHIPKPKKKVAPNTHALESITAHPCKDRRQYSLPLARDEAPLEPKLMPQTWVPLLLVLMPKLAMRLSPLALIPVPQGKMQLSLVAKLMLLASMPLP